MTKTVKDILLETTATFQKTDLETPVLDARLIVQHATGMTHEEILMNAKKIVSESELESLAEYTGRRLRHEPVSRIVGYRGFWKSNFKISPETLDPRMDSEVLIEAALAHVQPAKGQKPLKVLDLGTGTGCLLLSLLQEWPQATGIGVDISQGAVDVAQENAEALDLAGRAQIVRSDWRDFRPEGLFDVIISNPPYIGEGEKDALRPDVLAYDPPQALFAGPEGLEAYRTLARHIPDWLTLDGTVVLEVGYRQAKQVYDILAGGGLSVIETRRDLGGNDRVITARRSR